jgi:dTDP-glucose 4,6-dehydratase
MSKKSEPSKRVLVTGAGGFMGSHVLRHILTSTDWEVVIIDSFRHKGKIDRITQQLDGQDKNRVTTIVHDLAVPISEQMDYKIGEVDYVLNIASESHVDRSIDYPRAFIENNVHLMLTMLEWLKKRNTTYEYGATENIKKFIHISTDEVFGPAYGNHRHKEGEPHQPSNPYSASKACQEDICFSYWRTYGLPIIITNTMNLFGELQDVEKFIPMTIKKVIAGEAVSIHASADNIIGTRYYLHARNQADALLFILQNIEPTLYGEATTLTRYNVVGEREVSNLELAQLVSKFVGKPLKYKLVDFHSSRPGHDLRYALDGTKLAKEGWQQPLSFEDSLEKTVKWTMAHKEWLL